MYAQSTLTDVTRCSKNPLVGCLRVFRPEPKEEKRKVGFIYRKVSKEISSQHTLYLLADKVMEFLHTMWATRSDSQNMATLGCGRQDATATKM